jgi:hypothetical protein
MLAGVASHEKLILLIWVVVISGFRRGGRSAGLRCKPDGSEPPRRAVGQPDAIATLMRRTLTRTKRPDLPGSA